MGTAARRSSRRRSAAHLRPRGCPAALVSTDHVVVGNSQTAAGIIAVEGGVDGRPFPPQTDRHHLGEHLVVLSYQRLCAFEPRGDEAPLRGTDARLCARLAGCSRWQESQVSTQVTGLDPGCDPPFPWLLSDATSTRHDMSSGVPEDSADFDPRDSDRLAACGERLEVSVGREHRETNAAPSHRREHGDGAATTATGKERDQASWSSRLPACAGRRSRSDRPTRRQPLQDQHHDPTLGARHPVRRSPAAPPPVTVPRRRGNTH